MNEREKKLFDVIETQNERLKYNLRIANSTNNAKTRFLSNLSHEMRASVNAIMGMTEIAKKNFDHPEVIKEIVENMQTPINNLAYLLDHVTDVGDIESEKISIKSNRTNIQQMVKSCCDILQNAYKEKKQTIKVYYTQFHHNYILVDEVQLRSILMNILENAVKYTDDEGTIIFDVTEISCLEDHKSTYLFSIEDNGKGMSKELCKQVFDPNWNLQEKEKNKGVGFSIIKNLTELLNGQVSIYSHPGAGTKVVVAFPFTYIDQDKESEETTELSNSLVRKKHRILFGKKILLVEDERIHRQILVYNLQEQGVICDWVKSGEEAIEKLKLSEDGFYDCVITDIRLPGMKGNELAHSLRTSNRQYYHDIPIIAVSADAMAEDMEYYMQFGITTYMTKPVVPEKLYDVLVMLLNKG